MLLTCAVGDADVVYDHVPGHDVDDDDRVDDERDDVEGDETTTQIPGTGHENFT